MDKRQDKNAASTRAETVGPSAQDRYCVRDPVTVLGTQEKARRKGVETEKTKDKFRSCDVSVTCYDVRCS